MIELKKVSFIVVIILVLTSLSYIAHHSYSTSNNTISPNGVDSNYLINEQSFFDALNDTFDAPPCLCNSEIPLALEEEEEEVELQDIEVNTQDIEIPDKLPKPPKDVLNKINANLLKDDRVLIVATANYGMRNHVYNWIESLKRTGEEKFLIFCFDQKLYDHLKIAGYEDRASLIPDIWFHQQVEAEFKTYFTQEYRVITHSKTLVVQQLLYLDINVFFSDVDIVWLRPQMVDYVHTFLQIRKETQVIFQQEGLNQQEINSGFYLMRPTIEMKKLLAETIHIQDTVEGKTQQGAMNLALNHLNMDLRTSGVVLLDILHFPNGFVYYDNNLPNKHGIDPFIVHANYLVGEDKKKKLVESKMWYLDDTWLDQIDEKLLEKSKKTKTAKTTTSVKKKQPKTTTFHKL